MSTLSLNARYALAAITAAGLMTTIHHVYRLGLEVLIPFTIITLLPFLMLYLHQRLNRRWLAWGFGAVNTFIFIWFGFVDGFLDHVLKVLGFQNVTFLEGSDAEIVETVFSLWSPEAGYAFYEGTGVITFVLSVAAMYYTYRMLHTPSPALRPTSSTVS